MNTPPKHEARRYPRFELYAMVKLRRGDHELVLPARNISLGGIYLAAAGHRLNLYRVGESVDVSVFDVMDDGKVTLRTMAEVVRNEGQGLGLSWGVSDPALSAIVASLLERLNPLLT